MRRRERRASSARTIGTGRAVLGLLLVFAPGCLIVTADIGPPIPDDAAIARVQVGRSDRAEVLDLLGPPDEYRSPLPFRTLRAWDPGAERVLVEKDLFGRQAWTWVAERRHDRQFEFVPRVATLFNWKHTEHRADRLVVLFDDRGLVEAVGVDRGRDAP